MCINCKVIYPFKFYFDITETNIEEAFFEASQAFEQLKLSSDTNFESNSYFFESRPECCIFYLEPKYRAKLTLLKVYIYFEYILIYKFRNEQRIFAANIRAKIEDLRLLYLSKPTLKQYSDEVEKIFKLFNAEASELKKCTLFLKSPQTKWNSNVNSLHYVLKPFFEQSSIVWASIFSREEVEKGLLSFQEGKSLDYYNYILEAVLMKFLLNMFEHNNIKKLNAVQQFLGMFRRVKGQFLAEELMKNTLLGIPTNWLCGFFANQYFNTESYVQYNVLSIFESVFNLKGSVSEEGRYGLNNDLSSSTMPLGSKESAGVLKEHILNNLRGWTK